jgi:hypothetical protein
MQRTNFGEETRLDRRIRISVLAFVCVLVAGCGGKPMNDQDAVRTGIEKHLNGRKDLNLQAMTREVKQIAVSGDHATALVEFRLNGSDARMEVEYTLQRQGKEWTVLNSQGKAMGSGNPGAGQTPSGHLDPADKQLPPGHAQ